MKTISVSFFLLLMIMTTAISYAADKDTSATVTKNEDGFTDVNHVAEKSLTSEKTASKDKVDKDKPENADKKPTTEAPPPKNIVLRFFSGIKNFFVGKGDNQKANKQIKDDNSSKPISNGRNYDYFVDKDLDGICDGRHLNRQERQSKKNLMKRQQNQEGREQRIRDR